MMLTGRSSSGVLRTSYHWLKSSTRNFSAQFEHEDSATVPHIPVMAKEVIAALRPRDGQVFIDMTFGAGGHSRQILKSASNIKIIALDRDPDASSYAQRLAEEFPSQVTPLLGRFSELPQLLKSVDVGPSSVDGVLFDFGCSSMQFDRGHRGFSINNNGPLDMRMDKNRDPGQLTAAEVIATISEEDLYRVIKVYGEEKKARKIARAIIDVRHAFKRIETTHELANIVASCFDDSHHADPLKRPMHNATKTFQALRIFVNNELNEINYGMLMAHKYLKPNGRFATLTFHSLEDTIVKRHIAGNVVEGIANPVPLKYVSHLMTQEKEIVESLMESKWSSVYKHVLAPSEEEIDNNPRSRSAKLRAAIKKESIE